MLLLANAGKLEPVEYIDTIPADPRLGEPLTNFQGVLRGVPEIIGDHKPLGEQRA